MYSAVVVAAAAYRNRVSSKKKEKRGGGRICIKSNFISACSLIVIDCNKVIKIPIKWFTHRKTSDDDGFVIIRYSLALPLVSHFTSITMMLNDNVSVSYLVVEARIIDIRINFDINTSEHTVTCKRTYTRTQLRTSNVLTPFPALFHLWILIRIECNPCVSIIHSNWMIPINFSLTSIWVIQVQNLPKSSHSNDKGSQQKNQWENVPFDWSKNKKTIRPSPKVKSYYYNLLQIRLTALNSSMCRYLIL